MIDLDIPSMIDSLRTDENSTYLGSIFDLRSRMALAWPLELSEPSPRVDRRSQILFGPLFTSESLPWPIAAERFLQPILQIDALRINALAEGILSDEIIQIWGTAQGGVIRTVPRDEVATAKLSGIPSMETSAYHQLIFTPLEEEPIWLSCAREIIGYGDPFIDYDQSALEYEIDNALEHLANSGIRDKLLVIKEHLKGVAPRFVHRAFGMITGSMGLDPRDYPAPIITIEEDRYIGWGDGGSAHLCCDGRANSSDLSFVWSPQ